MEYKAYPTFVMEEEFWRGKIDISFCNVENLRNQRTALDVVMMSLRAHMIKIG